MVLFAVAERRSPAPMVPLRLFGERAVVVPNAALFLQSMVGGSWLYVLMLYLQEALGLTPLEAGLLFLPMTVSAVAVAPVAGRLANRFGLRPTVVPGLALVAVGVLLMSGMSPEGNLVLVVFGMLIGEVGFVLS